MHSARDEVRRRHGKADRLLRRSRLVRPVQLTGCDVHLSRAATKTALHLSRSKVTCGYEQTEKISVAVSHAYSGTPTGTVSVEAGRTTVCKITLKSAKGSCTLAAKKLRNGTYRLVARYGGSSDFTGSASAAASLRVVS